MFYNRIVFTKDGFEDYKYWESENKKILKRINTLIEDISRNGNQGIGKPELLKEDYAGLWSRRIDDKHRLIYRIEDNVIIIFACRTHYNEK